MKLSRKILGIIISLCIVLSLIPTAALAVSYSKDGITVTATLYSTVPSKANPAINPPNLFMEWFTIPVRIGTAI